MKNKILPILLAVFFLVSLTPTVLAAPNSYDAYSLNYAQLCNVWSSNSINRAYAADGDDHSLGFIGDISTGDFVGYKQMNFGENGAKSVSITAAVPNDYTGKSFEIRRGSATGKIIAKIALTPTGGWGDYQTHSYNIPNKEEFSGVLELYFVFSEGTLGNLRSFQFEKSASIFEDYHAFNNATEISGFANSNKEYGIEGGVAGDYVKYNVNFSDNLITGLTINAAGVNGGSIAFRLDSLTTEPLSIVPLAGLSGNWTTYADLSVQLNTRISGFHDLYITYENGADCSLKTFKFTKKEIPPAFKTLYAVNADTYYSDLNMAYKEDLPKSYVGNTGTSKWLCYKNMDFGAYGVNGVALDYGVNGEYGANVEFRKNGVGGEVIATVPTTSTGAWETFSSKHISIDGDTVATGVFDLYVVFTGTVGNIRSFKFDQAPKNVYMEYNTKTADSYSGVSVINEVFNSITGTDSYIKYENIDFKTGGISFAKANIASSLAQGQIYIKIDNIASTPIATVDIKKTYTTEEKYENVYSDILSEATKNITGKHDIYIMFSGADVCKLKSLSFLKTLTGVNEVIEASKPVEYKKLSLAGTHIGDIDYNSYAQYGDFYFGDTAKLLKLGVTYGTPAEFEGGTINIRLDSVSGPIVAQVQMKSTNGWETWQETVVPFQTTVTGVHKVFMTFSVNGMGNVKDFRFIDDNSTYDLVYEESAGKIKTNLLVDQSKISENTISYITALYDKKTGMLKGVTSNDVVIDKGVKKVTNEIPMDFIKGNYEVKSFVWDSQIKPLKTFETIIPDYDGTTVDAFAPIGVSAVGQYYGMHLNLGYMDRLGCDGLMQYKNIDFGNQGFSGLTANIATSLNGAKVSFYIDQVSETPFAVLTVSSTGDYNIFKDQTAQILNSSITGVHDIYMVFSDTGTCNLTTFNLIK